MTKRDLHIKILAAAIVLASSPASQALAAATPAKTGSAPAAATCSNETQDCRAGADPQRSEAREPQSGGPSGICGIHSADLEASLRLRCPRLYGPIFV